MKSATKLNARYTLRTDDGHLILVNAVGTVTAGPPPPPPPPAGGSDSSGGASGGRNEPVSMTQDDVEYFTQITFEAPGGSPYDWMNSVVAVGVMAMFEGKPIIDCYRLTNFPESGTAHL